MMGLNKLISALLIMILVLSISSSFGLSFGGRRGDEILQSGPDAPRGPIPEDGESGLNTTPELSVYVTHPDNLSMDVSFYDNSSDSLIETDTDVGSGELAEITWEGLSPDTNYSWYAVADDGQNTNTGGPWNFSTADVDYVRITDEPGGELLQGGDVPPDYTEWGYLSTYNQTSGYVGNFKGRWNVTGDAQLLGMERDNTNGIEMGGTAGVVWFNVTYEGDYHHGVKYTVLMEDVTRIEITKSPGGEPLHNDTVPIGTQIQGYSSAYNETAGFLYTIEGNWSAEGPDSELLEENLSEQNVIDVGLEGGDVWFNLSYSENQDTVGFEVEDPSIDRIEVRSELNGNGELIEYKEVPLGETVDLYASGYNLTKGFVKNLDVNWELDTEEVGDIDEQFGSSTTFQANDTGNCTVTAVYEGLEYSITFNAFYDGYPEIIGEIPDIDLGMDFGIHEFNLAEYADDQYDNISDLRWYITGHDPSVIEVLGENQTGNHNLTLLSEDNSHSSMQMRYHLVNSVGNEVTQGAWINVTSEDTSPEFRRCPDLKIHYDQPYEFDYSPYIIYDEDRKSELELETDDPEHTSVEGLTVTYEYPESMLGEEFLVILNVTDGQISDRTAITVEVTSNEPPEEREELPDLEIEQGQLKENVFDLDDYFSDPEGDPLYMSYGYTHLRITIHGDNTVDVEADVDWQGVETVTFRAEDPEGSIIEQTIEVTVVPINYPPEIKKLPEFVVHYDEPYGFDLNYYISDRDNKTRGLSISTDSPEYITVDGTELVMLYPEEMDGQTAALEVFVSDGSDTTSEVTTVTIGDTYPPEILIPLHDVAFKENGKLVNAFHLDNHFNDRQDDTIYYSSGNEHIDVVIHENSSVDFYAPKNWYGQELITIRATNSAGALMEDSLTVTVLPVNQLPQISDIPQQEGIEGESWIFDISDYISDVDNETHKLDVLVENPNVTVVGHKLIFNYDNPGEHEVTVEVSDGLGSNTTNIDVVVEPEEDGFFHDNWSFLLLAFVPLTLIGTAFYFKKGEFTIDDVFLIHDSGVLIKHKTRTLNTERDEEILAGMFTAVNNFVGDAFGGEEKHTLKRMEYGDDKVLVHKGENVILAVFLSGEEPSWILDSMSELVSDIEERYGGDLEGWDGDIESLPGIEDMLDKMIKKDGKYSRGDWEK